MRTPFWGGSQTAPSVSALNFGSLVQAGRGFLTAEASAAQVCSVAGTLNSFRVRLTTAPGTSKQYTFTIRKNGVDTGLTMVISGAATTGFIASPVTVAAGDWLTLSSTPSGTPSATGNISWATSFDSTNNNESPMLSCTFGGVMNVSSTTNCVPIQGSNASTTTAVNADGIVPVAGSITGFRVRFPAAVSAGSWQVILVKNGVDTAMTATVTGGAQTATSSGSAVAFATGDLIRFRVPGSSTPVAQAISIGATFAPTVDGNSFVIGGQQSLSNSSSLFWYLGPNPDGGNATKINRHTLSNACNITALYAQAKTTPVGGDSWTYNLNVNETQVATVATTTANVVSSTGLTVAVNDADRIEMGHVPAGTPAASISIWSVAVQIVSVTVSATGVSAAASVGSVSISTGTGVPVSITGVAASASVGSVSVTGGATVTPTGQSATASIGSVTIGEGSGASTTATGSGATASVGSGNISGGCNQNAGGSGCVGSVGSLSVSGAANVTAEGSEAVSSVGEVDATGSSGSNVEVNVTGVEAVASVGSVTVTTTVGGFFGTAVNTGKRIIGFNQGAPANWNARVKLTTGNAAKMSVGNVTIFTTQNVAVKVSGVTARFVTGKTGIRGDARIIARGSEARFSIVPPRIKTIQNLEDDELVALTSALW